ncbi:MAG: hypothetical protein M1820_005330 [Bogoriella megaspora]|nr:MAG: hypothetical protein M1820_005330 [Bogoriella megaspora]
MLSRSHQSTQHPFLETQTPHQKLSTCYPNGGLLTPPSSASVSSYGRRDSLTSWAATSISGTSSIAYSPQQPSTPVRPRNTQDEFIMLGSIDTSAGPADRRFATPSGSDLAHDLNGHADWSLDTPHDLCSRHNLGQHSFDADPEHWSQLSESFHHQIFPKPEDLHNISNGLPETPMWSAPQGVHGIESEVPSFSPQVDFSSNLPYRSAYAANQAGFTCATVIPSQTFVEADLDTGSNAATHWASSQSSLPSLAHSSHGYISDGIALDDPHEAFKEEHDWAMVPTDPDYVRVARIHETSTGAKGVKKGRKTSRSSCKRPKSKNQPAFYSGRTYDLKIEADARKVIEEGERDASGRLKITESKEHKRMCGWQLSDGEICTKSFNRPEHWNRHRKIHTGETPFMCVVPNCRNRKGNQKAFGRADNRKAHYETHLKKKKGTRNELVGFEKLCRYIREGELPEDAEKMIKNLRKKRAQGAFEPNDPVPRRMSKL